MTKREKQIREIVDKISSSEFVSHDSLIGREKGIELDGDEYKLIEPYYFGHYNLIFKPKDSKTATNTYGGAFGGATTEHDMEGKILKAYLDFYDDQRGLFVEIMKHILFLR